MPQSLILFLPFLLAVVAAGSTGTIFKPGPWYAALTKPGFTPPDWLFPVAWTAIYAFIAVAGARVAALPGAGAALALWSAQIALNTLWTPVFFGAHRIGLALIVLSALWLAVVAATALHWRLDRASGLLFLPYALWVSYAWALNLAIWRMNPA